MSLLIVLRKDYTPDDTIVVKAEVNKALAIVIHHTAPVPSHSSLTVRIIRSHLGIKVSHDQKHIMLGNFGNGML